MVLSSLGKLSLFIWELSSIEFACSYLEASMSVCVVAPVSNGGVMRIQLAHNALSSEIISGSLNPASVHTLAQRRSV